MSTELETIRHNFVSELGHVTQSLGAGRVIGQVFAHIYLSPRPCSLHNLTRELGISRGSASMTVRQLEHWGALKKVWVKGDRKDYYEASEELGHVLRRVMADTVSRLAEDSSALLEELESLAGKAPATDDTVFVKRRLRILRGFRKRITSIWNSSIVQMLLKK